MKKLMIVMMMVVMLCTVSASILTTHSYKESDLKVEFRTLGLVYQGDVILKSHRTVDEILKFGFGKEEVVIYYDFSFNDLRENGLGKVYFTDKRTDEIIEKDYSFVYWGTETKQRDVYGEGNCEIQKNGTICEEVVIGKENYEYTGWLDYNSRDIPSENIRIGLKTYINQGDYIDAVWTIVDEKISRHAEWTASLNVGLKAYYNMNDASGNFLDSVNNFDLINHGADYGATGIIGDGVGFVATGASTGDYVNISSTLGVTGFPYTQNVWFKSDTINNFHGEIIGFQGLLGANEKIAVHLVNDGRIALLTYVDEGDSTTHSPAANFDDNAWHMVTLVATSDTDKEVYVDTSSQINFTTGSTWSAMTNFYLGVDYNAPVWFYNGTLDEIGVWNRSLSLAEITQLYNSGTGLTYVGVFDVSPNVTINSPANNTNSTSSTITFNATITDDTNLDEVTLFIDGVVNETNSSGFNGTYIFTKTLVDGTHNWTIGAVDNISQVDNSTLRLFEIDTTLPLVTNLNLTGSDNKGVLPFHKSGNNITVTWNVADDNLEACWIGRGGANTTVTCGDNSTTINITNTLNKGLTFYANDSFGWESSTDMTWNYQLFQESESFTSSILEGGSSQFKINVVTNGTNINIANLTYNNTGNIGTLSETSDNFTITKNVTAPQVTTDTNITFFWNFTAGSLVYNLSEQLQLVQNFDVDNCSTNTNVLYNFTIVDEITQAQLNGATDNTTGDINLQIYTSDRSITISNYSSGNNETNPFQVCLSDNLSSGSSFKIDVQLQYDASGYGAELYHIKNSVLTSDDLPTHITLFDLDDSNAQEFKITYKDGNFLPVADALVQIQRKYINEGIFKVVEIPITDANGETLFKGQLGDVVYTLIVIKGGEVLATFDNVLLSCDNVATGDCEINLNSFTSHVAPKDYTTLDDFTFTLDFNEDTRTISTVYTIPSSTVATVNLNTTLYDLVGDTVVCSDTVTSSAGTLTCVVPASYGNVTVVSVLNKNGVSQATGIINLQSKPSDIYGANQVFLSLFLFATLIGIGISANPLITGFFILLGGVLSILLNITGTGGVSFIGAGASILWLVIVVVIIFIKGSKRT